MSHNTEVIGPVAFPRPQNINVNMMPFVLGDPDSLPEELRAYQPLIDACEVEAAEQGSVCYLTISETAVQPGSSQRRGGAHTERHPNVSWGGGGWGGGRHDGRRHGGLYIASTMEATTAVWDARIENPGPGGDCSDRLEELGESSLLDANQLVWLTDATPHASLPVPRAGTRQFFRLVTSQIDLWYEDHSTANALVSVPAHVRTISGNKF
jgi:hypothetical protein